MSEGIGGTGGTSVDCGDWARWLRVPFELSAVVSTVSAAIRGDE